MMKYLFTYGPVPVYEAENVSLQETEFGLSPKNWDYVKLKKIFKLTSCKTRPNDLDVNKSFGYPVYGGNGIIGYSKKFLINFNTIILGRVGEYCGSVHMTDGKSWITDNALYAKKFIDKKPNLNYLAYAIQILNLNRLKNRGGQPLITQSIVYSQSIPIPNSTIQQDIARLIINLLR